MRAPTYSLPFAVAAAVATLGAGCTGRISGPGDAAESSQPASFDDELLDRLLPPERGAVAVELSGSEAGGFTLVLQAAGGRERLEVNPEEPARAMGAPGPWGSVPIPVACDVPVAKLFYVHAYLVSVHFFARLAHHLRSCDLADLFAERVASLLDRIAALAPPPDERRLEHCAVSGIVDGGFAVITRVLDECAERCLAAGEAVGRESARAYCAAADAAGAGPDPGPWTRGDLGSCGLGYETGCDAAFIGESTIGTCEPYTTGADRSAWDHTRLLECDYRNRPDGVLP